MTRPTIPGTALGGEIVRGWIGPCEQWRYIDGGTGVVRPNGQWGPAIVGATYWRDLSEIRLDPTRPEVAHRIADVLRALGHEVGHFLPVALGGRVVDAVAVTTCDCLGVATVLGVVGDTPITRPCPDCGGTGSIRRPVPAAEVSAAILVACVAGVEARKGVVRGLLGMWTNDHGYWVRVLRIGRDVGIGGVTVNDSGWCVPTSRIDPHRCDSGPENGAEGRACADAALLRLGFAYLDSSAPFGVRVPFNLENER